MRRLRKFLALPSAGRTIVLRSLLLLPLVAVLLRLNGMARTTGMFGRLGHDADPGKLLPQETARLVNSVAAILRVACLARSLVLWHLLRCRGAKAEVCLGVAKLAGGKLSAHAWVELDGLPLDDGANIFERYAALPFATTKFGVARPLKNSF